MSDFTLLDDQTVALGISETDDAGNPVTPVQGTISWVSSDETIVTVAAQADGTAVATAVGPLGDADVKLDAQVTDASGNTVDVTDTLTVHVNASAPTAIAIVPGTPAHK